MFGGWICLDGTNVLQKSLLEKPTMQMLGSVPAFQLFVRAPEVVKQNIAAFLEPWPEVVAIGQTERLVRHIRFNSAPSDSIVYARLAAPIYLSMVEFLGKRYVSNISNSRRADDQTYELLEICCDRLICLKDHFGIRGIYQDPSRIPRTTQDVTPQYITVDIKNTPTDSELAGQSNVGSEYCLDYMVLTMFRAFCYNHYRSDGVRNGQKPNPLRSGTLYNDRTGASSSSFWSRMHLQMTTLNFTLYHWQNLMALQLALELEPLLVYLRIPRVLIFCPL